MQQYYTLEEAASHLQISADELREMAKSKKIRAFQDRGSWRFRSQDIDEEARRRGIGSDPELQLGDATVAAPRPPKGGKSKPPEDEDLISIDFALDDKPSSGPKSPKSGPKTPPKAADSDVRLAMDSNLDFQIDLDSDVRLEQSPKPPKRKSKLQPGDSSVRLVGEKPSDSDVKVVPAATDSDVKPRPTKSPSDSDIRLHDSDSRKKKKIDPNIVTEEEIDIDAEEAKLKQKSGEVKKPRLTQAATNPVLPTTSPFELSEPEFDLEPPAAPPKGRKSPDKVKSEKDSSSDFELVPFDQSKSPVDLGSGDIPLLAGDEEVELGELGGPNAGTSGINLQDPADSGISLESGGSDEMEFELTLDSGVSPKTPKPAKPDSSDEVDDDSSSEFELSLDDDSPSDPSSSEFELSLDDSGDAIDLRDESGSDSEFELTLDDEGGLAVDDDAKDIFEPTNFDVPALDDESGSEAVAIDEADTDLDGSDFEVSLDEDSGSGSKSQVVALEGEEEADTGAATVARPRKTGKKKAAAVEEEEGMELDLDLEEEPKKKPKKKAAAEDEEEEEEEEEERAAAPAAPAEWGALPAILLMPTVIVLFVVGLMGYELVQGMASFNRPGKSSKLVIEPIAKPIAEAVDAKLPE